MQQVKYAENHGWDFGVRQLAEVINNDYQIKTASESLEYACGITPKSNQTVIVVIAMGSTESYGPNRNSDGFGRSMLQKCHPTFGQFGHVFVNHKNKDPKKSVGSILNSFYNPDMDRVELVLGLNNDRASKFVNRIHQGRPIPVSMGLRIPYDVCDICDHQAPTIKQWCHHMDRKGKFGANTIYYLSNDPSLGYPAKDGSLIFVHNPSGRFFDISLVTRPADRTAYMIYGPRGLEISKLAAYREDMLAHGYPPEFIDYQLKTANRGSYDEGILSSMHPAEGGDPQQGPNKIENIETAYNPEKVADMIKRVDGLAGGLEAFNTDGEFISDKQAEYLTRHGIGSLTDMLTRVKITPSFPEVFKLAHMAIHDSMPSKHEIKMAAAYQREFLEFTLNNPAVKVFSKRSFGLEEKVASRNINYIRRTDWGTTTDLHGSDYSSTTKKEAASCGLVAASIFLEQTPSAETLCRGQALAGTYSKRRLEVKRAELALYDDPGKLFLETSKTFGDIIF